MRKDTCEFKEFNGFLKEGVIPKHYENDENGDLIAVDAKPSRFLYEEYQPYDLWENDSTGRLIHQQSKANP